MSGAGAGGPEAAGSGRGEDAAAGAGDLARRYRRLLAWYPRDHRAEHAGEMLGVLMDGARPGQAWPGARDAGNLVAGALRIRLRRAGGCFGVPRWRDALAVVSVLAPLLTLTMLVEQASPGTVLAYFRLGTLILRFPFIAWLDGFPGQVSVLAGWMIAVLMVVRRQRRGALVAAAVTVSWQALILAGNVSTGPYWLGGAQAPEEFFLGVVTTVSLVCSDGPGRGFQILGRRRAWLIAGGLLAWAAAHNFAEVWDHNMMWDGQPACYLVTRYTTMAALAVAVPVGGICLRSAVGRRVMVLAGPAASPYGVLYLAAVLAGAHGGVPAGLAGKMVWAVYLVLASVVTALAVAAQRRPARIGPLAASPGE